MLTCPKCNNQLFLNAFTNDNEGESITVFYRCVRCKIEFSEDEILNECKEESLKLKNE